MLMFGAVGLLIAGAATACAASEGPAQSSKQRLQNAGKSQADVTNERLPPNQRFASLDRYLLYLQNEVGPTDGAWYRMIGPGLYQLEPGNARRLSDSEGGDQEKRIFTREELMRKFGFTK